MYEPTMSRTFSVKWVGTQSKGPRAMRLELKSPSDSGDRRLTLPSPLRHLPRTPMRRSLRHGLKRLSPHLLNSLVVELAVNVWARTIRQPGNSIVDKSFPPLTKHAQVGFHFSSDAQSRTTRARQRQRQRLRHCSTASMTSRSARSSAGTSRIAFDRPVLALLLRHNHRSWIHPCGVSLDSAH